MRAAILAAAMSLTPVAAVDIFRFLNVPAIVLTLRRQRGRVCTDVHARSRPAERMRGKQVGRLTPPE